MGAALHAAEKLLHPGRVAPDDPLALYDREAVADRVALLAGHGNQVRLHVLDRERVGAGPGGGSPCGGSRPRAVSPRSPGSSRGVGRSTSRPSTTAWPSPRRVCRDCYRPIMGLFPGPVHHAAHSISFNGAYFFSASSNSRRRRCPPSSMNDSLKVSEIAAPSASVMMP